VYRVQPKIKQKPHFVAFSNLTYASEINF